MNPKTKQIACMLQMSRPYAYAAVRGSNEYPLLEGLVCFYKADGGTVVTAEVSGLPDGGGDCGGRVFGFHVHTNGDCSGTTTMPFENVDGHYNPRGCEHPHHAGDMPPLFGMDGYAWSSFFTTRFIPKEVVGRAVIIHLNPDDFVSQPSGNAGPMIACGRIVRNR